MMEETKSNWRIALSNAFFQNSFVAPFKGIQYFSNDSQLWVTFLAICIPSAVILIIVFSTLSITVFPPYVTLVVLVTGPLGFISATITLLDASRRMTVMILHVLFMRRIQATTFDRVLTNEGAGEIVAQYTDTKSQLRPEKSLEARIYNQTLPFITREILYLVLGIIPLIGPLIVLVVKAPIKGYKSHKHFYKLKMWDYPQINRFFKRYHSDYTSFGFVALLLEMIPGLTICFMFTNNIGMAIWTAKYHQDFDDFIRKEPARLEAEGIEFWENCDENNEEAQEDQQHES